MMEFENPVTLTTRQQEIYDFLREKILNRGYGPTVREIGAHFDIRSPNGVMCHLKALERKGLIIRESNMSRAIQLADNSQQKTVLPLLGTGVSGAPWQPADAEHVIEFGALFQAGNRVCIRIAGSAFVALGIFDGDHLIVAKGVVGHPGSLHAGLDDRNCLLLSQTGKDGSSHLPALAGAYPAKLKQLLGVIVGVVRYFAADANDRNGSHFHPRADGANPAAPQASPDE